MASIRPPERHAPIMRLAALVVWFAAATGCAVVPGISMDTDRDPVFVPGCSDVDHRGPLGRRIDPERDPRIAPGCADADRYIPEVRRIDATLLLEQARQRRELRNGIRRPRAELIASYEYLVGPGDTLLTVIWDHPELNNPFGQFQNIEQQGRLVRRDGTIFFPYIGVLEVAGLTVEEIRQRISEALVPFVPEPQVDVRVAAHRNQRVYVTGEVRQPGILPLTDEPMTALDAINLAGGLADTADRRRLEVNRESERLVIDALELYARGYNDLLLRDQDVIYVPDNHYNQVFVMGEISQQATVPLHSGRLSLAEAISQAGGFDLARANTEAVYVLRGEPVYHGDELLGIRPSVFALDASSGTTLLLAEGFELEPRDIVYVSSSPIVRFNRIIGQFLPTVQTIWQTQRILRD